MKKPWWLRLAGWVDVGAWVLTAAFLYRWSVGFHTPDVAFGLFLFAFIAVVLGAVWFILSALLWGMNRQARTSAAVLRDAMAAKDSAERMARPATDRKGEPSPPPGSVVLKCDHCPAGSVLWCHTHGANMCWKHVLEHDSGACWYELAVTMARFNTPDNGERRRVPTSPFSGIR